MRGSLGLALCLLTLDAGAQARLEQPVVPKPADDATTLETIRVTAPRPETLDLYHFKNPVGWKPSAIDCVYDAGPSLEERALANGVSIVGVNQTLKVAPPQAKRKAGCKSPERPAIARPPPLTEEQMQRAVRLQESPQQP